MFLRSSVFILSFLLVSWAQPDKSPLACCIASLCGYALFWKEALTIQSRGRKFLLALAWFSGIQAFQLNWFFADQYVGLLIYPALFTIFILLGIQFAILTLFVSPQKKCFLPLAGAWVLLEGSRFYFFSGYSWNPVGLALTGTFYGMQGVAFFGILGLSFWVILTNLCFLGLFCAYSKKNLILCLGVALLPYGLGALQVVWHSRNAPQVTALLVQTALTPEQKIYLTADQKEPPLSPTAQWERILWMLAPHFGEKIDLIVFPEGVVPYGTNLPIYDKKIADQLFEWFFGEKGGDEQNACVANAYWIQKIARLFHASVIIGLEDRDQEGEAAYFYNAGFLFKPSEEPPLRYEKRILLPIAEYFPFHWCQSIASHFDISGCYTPGREAKVFDTPAGKIALSICYEETFGHLIRESRQKGAELLVNLSNDVWYPRSRLPIVHYMHGRLRAVENGVPLIRACNTGVTCGVDHLGRELGMLDYEQKGHPPTAGCLKVAIPWSSHRTLYSLWGDIPLLLLSCCFVVYGGILLVRKEKLR